MEDEYEQRLKILHTNKVPVHIKTKNDTWYNGDILEIGNVFLILKEYKYGRTLVFFSDIISLDVYNKKEGKDGTNNN